MIQLAVGSSTYSLGPFVINYRPLSFNTGSVEREKSVMEMFFFIKNEG